MRTNPNERIPLHIFKQIDFTHWYTSTNNRVCFPWCTKLHMGYSILTSETTSAENKKDRKYGCEQALLLFHLARIPSASEFTRSLS